nr:monovalent cation/H(+) antiporter subunit G [Lentibacillus sp. CBA3610]
MIENLIEIMLNILIAFLLLSGTFFLVSSSIGVIRFSDVYARLHATTKAATLGISGLLIGVCLFMHVEHKTLSGQLLLAIVFVLLTAPVAAHMISKAAHQAGIKPVAKDKKVKFNKTIQKQKQYQK